MISQRKIGYPSIDKPWLNYYEKVIKNEDILHCSAYHLLYEKNRKHMDDVALIYFNKKITYRKLFEKIHSAAESLSAIGIKEGDIITLQVLNMPQTVVLFYAISYIGAIANIIFVTTNENELYKILYTTESKMYVTMDSIWLKQKNTVKSSGISNVLVLSAGEEADAVTKAVFSIKRKKVESCYTWSSFLKLSANDVKEIDKSDAPVAMVYTSGTTGKSKAVVISNNSMNALVAQYEGANIGFVEGGVFMNTLPQFIAFGLVFSMHVPLCLNMNEILVLDPNPTSTGKYFAKYKPNYYVGGKLSIESIMQNSKIKKMNLEFVKVLGAGGEAIPVSFENVVNQFLQDRNAETTLSIGYGMTEVASTVVTSTPYVSRVGTVGIPLPATIIKVVEQGTMKELTYNQDGEICFNAPSMMLGYFKDREETDNIIKKHEDGLLWVHSGDIGRISEEGFLSVVGRIKRIVEIREDGIYHKVFPKNIEDVLEKVNGVKAIAVVGRKKAIVENVLIGFVVKSDDVEESELVNDLKQKSKSSIESWERPKEYVVIEEIPRTTVGKVDYRKLEEMTISRVSEVK